MRQDAILHSRITAPFSSQAPVAVDEPDLQVDKLVPRFSAVAASEMDPTNVHEDIDMSIHGNKTMDDSSSFQMSDTQTLVEEGHDDTLPQINNQRPVSTNMQDSQDPARDEKAILAAPESDLFSSHEYIEEERLSKLQVWFGDLSRVGFDTKYLALRDHLSDAAYWGRFEELFQVLAGVEVAYGQSWANAAVLST